MTDNMFFTTTSSGTSGDILRILKEYGQSLPITFLEDVLREDADKIEESLSDLEERGVVERKGDSVGLAP